MELGLGNTLLAGDPRLVDHIVGEVKSQGIFDQFRKECIADVDTKPAYQNLRTRVESSVNSFLSGQTWKADLNKNQLRETLRKHIHEAPYLDAGVERIVDQVVNPKVYSVFMPQIEDVVYKFLGIERPKNRQKNGSCGFKDLLPKDLDPVSPESDKNSLKDVSLDSVDANLAETEVRDVRTSIEEHDKSCENQSVSGKNGSSIEVEKPPEESAKPSGTLIAGINLNNSGKSEEKVEEEEEDSPMFEPIDIMNLNESNISNDSHLSGISELTSHRSHSPDFSNETSRDNMDFSNQDSQFSKVSSDSRLSIVTDFGSSNHASTPVSDTLKEEKDRVDSKYVKNNFTAVRDFETTKGKDGKANYENNSIKEENRGTRRSFTCKETSRDGTDLSKENRGESRDKNRDAESLKLKIVTDGKKEKECRRKSSSEVKSSKRSKEKAESSRDNAEKSKDGNIKVKETERKESSVGKEIKDLKDIYKEKIRELREKKELTEKERLFKDGKSGKESREKRDSSRESKKESKDHKSASTKSSSRSETKIKPEGKGSRSESRGKRDERKHSKEHRSKNNNQGSMDSSDKPEVKRMSKSEKDDKMEVSELKQDPKQKTGGKSGKTDCNKSGEGRRDSKGETEGKDKRRRDDKKSKAKDDHSSLRKNSDDRRSTDRDGSNGSNGRGSQKSNSSSGSSPTKAANSSVSKESTNTSNSSSETSDSIEEKQNEKSIITIDTRNSQVNDTQDNTSPIDVESTLIKRLDVGEIEISLPIKKRPLLNEVSSADMMIKKPKFAKNFQEAKRLMKIRRRMEKEKKKRELEVSTKNETMETVVETAQKIIEDDLKKVPDEERVQIIEVCDEEYDEPYPEMKSDFTLEERSQIILGGESIFTSDIIAKPFNAKSTLSEMEMSIRQSLNEMISDNKLEESKDASINPQNSLDSDCEVKIEEPVDLPNEKITDIKDFSNKAETSSTVIGDEEASTTQRNMVNNLTKFEAVNMEPDENENSPKDDGINEKIEQVESHEFPKSIEEDLKDSNFLQPTSSLVLNIEINESVEETEKCNDEIRAVEELEEIEEEQADGQKNGQSQEIIEKSNREEEELRKSENVEDEISRNRENDEIIEKEVKDETDKIATLTNVPPSSSTDFESTEMKKCFNTIEKSSCNKPETTLANLNSTEKESTSYVSEDEGPCLYFVEDNERLEKFTKFRKMLENEESSVEEVSTELSNSEDLSSVEKTMAPPKPKRKYSTSPLTDILLNSTNNNNDAHKITEPIIDVEDGTNNLKKRKIGRPKKQRLNASLCSQQNLSNGENFVMPLSPESDVSATSEKTPSNPLKDEKSRPRGSNQRYTSDDLYKPRPLFSSSSRRSRRSNQA